MLYLFFYQVTAGFIAPLHIFAGFESSALLV